MISTIVDGEGFIGSLQGIVASYLRRCETIVLAIFRRHYGVVLLFANTMVLTLMDSS